MPGLPAPLAAVLLIAASACSKSADPAPVYGFSRTVLPVRHLRQEPLLCVPTSAAMVLAFYGDPHSPRLLKSLAAGRPFDPGRPFTDFTITYYDDILKAVRQLGYDWRQRSFANDAAGFAGGLALIEAELRVGHPVLVDATLPTGHTFVIRGFDAIAEQLFIVDPDQAAPGVRSLSFEDFRQVWNEHAYGNDIRAMIVTRPNPNKA